MNIRTTTRPSYLLLFALALLTCSGCSQRPQETKELSEMPSERQLNDQLSEGPIVEITGVVGATGVGAGKFRGEQLWILSMSFDAWRVESGPVRTDPLIVRRKVSDDELRTLQDGINAETVVKIRARLVDDNANGSPQARLEEFIQESSSDSELNAHLAELKKPITHQDDFFGTLTFDRRVNWYEGKAVWNGNTITLNISAEQPAELNSALKVARTLWDDEVTWSRRITDFAVQELLPLKNENWLDESDAEVSPEQFKERMKLESIGVYPDGAFEFFHGDGDLFWGHSIQVTGSVNEGPTDADIPG